MYTPVNPSFTIQKWGLGGQYYIGMFSWWALNCTQLVLFRNRKVTVVQTNEKVICICQGNNEDCRIYAETSSKNNKISTYFTCENIILIYYSFRIYIDFMACNKINLDTPPSYTELCITIKYREWENKIGKSNHQIEMLI